ncbi:MAG: copper resistance protein CopC [Acidobacteria bacterium]|nr:copper resistance protein CopC [Acidobacteriota bacterium]
MSRFLPAVLLLTGLTLSAFHFRVEKTMPAEGATITVAPKQIQIWFSEAPTMVVSSITVTGPSGKVELGNLAPGRNGDGPDNSVVADVKGALSPGKYTVSWRASGRDGHMLTGTFEFTLKTG